MVLTGLVALHAKVASAVVVFSDDADGHAHQEALDSGLWMTKYAGGGTTTYYEFDKIHLNQGDIISTVGEWNPEGDEVYPYPPYSVYPPGTPKPVQASFEYQATSTSSPRLFVRTRATGVEGIDNGAGDRGLTADIRMASGGGIYNETAGSGLANNGTAYGFLNYDGSTATTGGAVTVTGTNFTGWNTDCVYEVTITDTIDLFTVFVEGVEGIAAGEWIQFEKDLSGMTHRNESDFGPYNHLTWKSQGTAILDNVLIMAGLEPEYVPEPASLLLLAGCGLALLARRRP